MKKQTKRFWFQYYFRFHVEKAELQRTVRGIASHRLGKSWAGDPRVGP